MPLGASSQSSVGPLRWLQRRQYDGASGFAPVLRANSALTMVMWFPVIVARGEPALDDTGSPRSGSLGAEGHAVNGAVVAALADPGLRARLADLGLEIFSRDQQTPKALSRLAGRGREMVANHQGGSHQGRMTARSPWGYGSSRVRGVAAASPQ
jgi:hypothetical protein